MGTHDTCGGDPSPCLYPPPLHPGSHCGPLPIIYSSCRCSPAPCFSLPQFLPPSLPLLGLPLAPCSPITATLTGPEHLSASTTGLAAEVLIKSYYFRNAFLNAVFLIYALYLLVDCPDLTWHCLWTCELSGQIVVLSI